MLLARQDDQVPLEETVAALAAVPQVTVHGIDARHYSFLAPCTTLGRWFAGDICADPAGVSRSALHREAGRLVREFFAGNAVSWG